jgi:hypothetical protein
MRTFLRVLIAVVLMAPVWRQPAEGSATHASGGGTYFVEPGVRSEFQFNHAHVQCKVGHAVLHDGTTFQMFMASTRIDSVSIDTANKSVVITGDMVSIVQLRFPNGTSATLKEIVPFVARAEDHGTPGAGKDFFSLTVIYTSTPALDQFDLFGSPATFAGTLETGDVEVRW